MSVNVIRKVNDIKAALKTSHGIDGEANEQDFKIALEDYHGHLKSNVDILNSLLSHQEPDEEQEEGFVPEEAGVDRDLTYGGRSDTDYDPESGWFEDSRPDEIQGESFMPGEERVREEVDVTAALSKGLIDGGINGLEVSLGSMMNSAAGYNAYQAYDKNKNLMLAIEFFIKEYGLPAFLRDSWDIINDAWENIELEEELAPKDEVPDTGRLEWESLEPIREITRKQYMHLYDATPTKNIYLNVAIDTKFYRQEDSPETYEARLNGAIESAEENSVTALNFYDIFSELGDDAAGYMIEDVNGKPHAVMSIGKIQAIRQAILNRLAQIRERSQDAKKDLNSASLVFSEDGFTISAKRLVETAEIKRQIISDQLDDLVSAIKKRDEYISHELYEMGRSGEVNTGDLLRTQAFSVSKIIRDSRSEVFKLLLEVVNQIVFIDLEAQVYHLKGGDKNASKVKFRESWTTYEEPFEEKIQAEIKRKIRNFFTRQSRAAWVSKSFCRYMTSQISRDKIREGVVNVVSERVTTSWNYADCSVCGKSIYTRKSKESYGQSRKSGSISPEAYSEYKTQMYSLVRHADGQLITTDMLQQVDEDGNHIRFEPPPTLAQVGAGSKTWAEIGQMVSSGSRDVHAEGVRRQAWALKTMGAARIPGGEVQISDKRFRCPYSNASDRPPELRADKLSVKDQTCGLDIDLSPIFDSSAGVPSAWELQTAGGSAGDIEGHLDQAVEEGLITTEVAQDILSELEKRRAGGWKFSNKYFNCPTRILGEEGGTISDHEELLNQFSFIASPISGPISADKLALIEAGDKSIVIDHDSSQLHPPSDGLGGYSLPEEGTLSYLVCGAHVSLSSFDRSLFSELLKSIVSESMDNMKDFIEALISMGVEVSDIIPFLSNASSPEAAIDELESAGRLDKLSGLLSLAMASPVDLDKKVRHTGKSRMEILQDLVLVCRHGHKFSVKDSLYFGRTHTGISLSNRRGSVYNKRQIARSGLLSSEGLDNFDISTRLFSNQGDHYIVELSPEDLLGSDSERFFEYSEWVDRVDKVKRVAFGVPGSKRLYTFGAISRDYIWGSEQRARWSTARPRETKDPKTTVFIESNTGLEDSMDDQEDGRGLGAQGRASLAVQNDNEDFFILGRENEYLKDQAAGVLRITTPVGEVLKSLLISCRDFLRMATTLDIEGRLVGEPILFRERYDDEIEANIYLIIRALVNTAKAVEDKEDIVDDAFAIVRGGLLEALYDVDHRFLAYLGRAFHKELIVEMSKAVLIAARNRHGAEAVERYRRTLFSRGTGGSSLDVQSIRGIMMEDASVSDVLTRITNALTISLGGSESKKIVDPGATTDKVVKMRGQEYMGRVIHAASAFYLADVISRIYNMYMKDPRAMAYVGYDIGADLSSPDKIIALSDSDIQAVVVGVSSDIAKKIDSERRQKERYKIKDESQEVDFESAWYQRHYDNINKCLMALRAQAAHVMAACTSRPYQLKAVDYIRSSLTEVVDAEEEAGEATESSSKARAIIDNVLTNIPFTSIGMSHDGKYARFHQGVRQRTSGSKGRGERGKRFNYQTSDEDVSFELIPPFAAVIADFNGPEDYFPIYVLTERGAIYHQFDINVPEPPSNNFVYVLCKSNIPGSIELEDVVLPDSYSESGWMVLSVDRRDKRFIFEASSRKSVKLVKNKGIKEGISLINHPATKSVESDGVVIGYVNEELGFDTTRGFYVGSMSTRSGADLSFPPTQMGFGVNSVGVPIPLDYRGEDVTKNATDIPIASARIPVSLLGSSPGPMIDIEMSDLLQRSPKDEAFEILREIERVYVAYEAELREQKIVNIGRPDVGDPEVNQHVKPWGGGLIESEKEKVRLRYRKIIRALFDQYRGMPYNVVKTGCGTKTSHTNAERKIMLETGGKAPSRASRYSVRNSYYIPFVDFVLMHRFLTRECFSPEWGGHQLWSPEENLEQVNEKRDAIEQFVINAHGLNTLAAQLIKILDAAGDQPGMNIRNIHVTDMLDPYNRLIRTGKVSEKEALKYFGLKLENIDEFGYVVGFNNNATVNMIKHFRDWAYSPGQFYFIGQKDAAEEESDCYINVMNIIFPRPKDKDRIALVQDPAEDGVMTTDDMYDYTTKIMRGFPSTSRFYPGGGVKAKKTGGVIGAYLYAGAIGEYLRSRMEEDLVDIKDRFGAYKKGGVQMIGHIKYSKKLKTDLYRGGIIMDAKLYALWNLITK